MRVRYDWHKSERAISLARSRPLSSEFQRSGSGPRSQRLLSWNRSAFLSRAARAVPLPVLAMAMVGARPVVHAQDFKKQVIYQVVTDRFYDGDTSNDNPAESPGLFDSTHTQWQAYWGGDLAGVQQQLSYIKGMGATAIWISPPSTTKT